MGDLNVLELFASEARPRLARVTEMLMHLEREPGDAESIAGIFREVHTLKGTAGMVGLTIVSSACHRLEDLLHDARAGTITLSRPIVDNLVLACDALNDLVELGLRGGNDSEQRELAGRIDAAVSRAVAGDAPDMDDEVTVAVAVAVAAESIEDGVDESPTDQQLDAREVVSAIDVAALVALAGDMGVRASRLDDIVRLVTEAAAAHARIGSSGSGGAVAIASLAEYRALSRSLAQLEAAAMRTRMLMISSLTERLARAVDNTADLTEKSVTWEIRGGDTELDRAVIESLADPLIHLVRNAVDHGIEPAEERISAGKPATGTVRLHAMPLGSEVVIAVSDDGRGINTDLLRQEGERLSMNVGAMRPEEIVNLIFRSGLSTSQFVSDVSGRGVGMDVVRTNVEQLRGRIEVDATPGKGTEFRLVMPVSLAVLPCVVVEVGEMVLAVPQHSILAVVGRNAKRAGTVTVGGRDVPVSSLATVLGIVGDATGETIVMAGVTRSYGFRVGRILGQREVVVKPLGAALPPVPSLIGGSIEADGSVLLVLDARALIDVARRRGAHAGSERDKAATTARKGGHILVVDDAATVRELQRSILERGGYRVTTAADGAEALEIFEREAIDLVLTDVEMPRLDGFELTAAIRRTSDTPVVILTSRASVEDRRRGVEVGANGYMTKQGFEEASLFQIVLRLLRRDGAQ